MTENQITFYVSGDKANPELVNIRATGGTWRIKDEFKARGFTWTGAEWEKSQVAATSKPDADWAGAIPDSRIFVGGRLMRTTA